MGAFILFFPGVENGFLEGFGKFSGKTTNNPERGACRGM
jgi:hypothetical protein